MARSLPYLASCLLAVVVLAAVGLMVAFAIHFGLVYLDRLLFEYLASYCLDKFVPPNLVDC